jgi:small subunit ribosomal protein S8
MAMVDPLADMYTRIRNASRVKKETVDVPASKIKESIAKILKEEGFIDNYKVLEEDGHKLMRIKLKYAGKKKESVISNIKQISKPGLRVYVDSTNIPKVLGGFGVAIVTTSKGLMVDEQCRKLHIGGEVLCNVW